MGGATKCAVVHCGKTRYKARKANDNDLAIHAFPQQSDLYEKWVQFCQQGKDWEPSEYDGICSDHFRKEDYQMESSPAVQVKRRLRMIFPNAIPSIFDRESYTRCHGQENTKTVCSNTVPANCSTPKEPVECVEVHSLLENYRELFCRVCLNLDKNGPMIPVETQIETTTVIDMMIQLTGFEVEYNDAYPAVICTDCFDKLAQAFNIRQEFIEQAELLVQMVAEQKLMEHYIEKLEMDFNGLLHSEQQPIPPFESLCIDKDDHSGYAKSLQHNSNAPDGHISEDDLQNSTDGLHGDGLDEDNSSRTHCDLNPEGGNGGYPWSEDDPMPKRRRKKTSEHDSEQRKNREAIEAEARRRYPLTKCYICEKQHDTLTDLELHLREHISMLPYQCTECTSIEVKEDGSPTTNRPPIYRTTNQLNRHFMMHHMPHKCDKCYRRFRTSFKLKTHKWDYHGHGTNGLTCEYCGKQFFRRILFRTHVSYHLKAQIGQFKCSFCDRAFGSSNSLRRHQASHTGEKKHKCLYCDKTFTTSYNRLAHQRGHTGELSYKCPDCDRSFVDSSRLRGHQERYHKTSGMQNRIRGQPPLTSANNRCSHPGCDYTATTYAAMYSHKRTKHRPKHQCNQCNKLFVYAHQLRNHMALHTGEKPFQCEQCDRKFGHVDNFRRHMKTHTPDSNCICGICQKSFKLKRYLRAHMLTHTSMRTFPCAVCGKCYKTNGELKKHCALKHGESKQFLKTVEEMPEMLAVVEEPSVLE